MTESQAPVRVEVHRGVDRGLLLVVADELGEATGLEEGLTDGLVVLVPFLITEACFDFSMS